MARDAKGIRDLGYCRSGTMLNDLTDLKYDYDTKVHDENRNIWTSMNPTERRDVQKKMTDLVMYAAKKMKDDGKDIFEHGC